MVALVSAAGVPRAFRYVVGAGEVEGRRLSDLDLRIAQPASGVRFDKANAPKTLKLLLHADGPVSVGESDAAQRLRVEVGIDQNGNKKLDDAETRLLDGEFWAGRRVERQLVVAGKPAELRIGSVVRDIEVDVETAGLEGLQTFAARLSHARIGNPVQASSTYYFLNEPPAIAFEAPRDGDKVSKGTPVSVALRADETLFGAVDDVQFAFSADGAWPEKERVIPLGKRPGEALRFDERDTLEARLPTDKASAGRIFLLARAITRVLDEKAKEGYREWASAPLAVEVNIGAAAGAPDASGAPKFGKVAGKVVPGTVIVTVKIPGVGETRSGLDGAFSFDKVPVGDHKLEAEGTRHVHQAPVAVKVEEGKTTTVEIPLRLK
jgi:hypothetical protein